MATKVERKIIKTNKKHNERRSELHVAAARGDLNRTQSLVLQGAIVNDSSKHWDKATPIFGAAESRVIDTVKYLLRCGADPTHVALSGHTCFHEACKAGYLPVVKLLAEYRCKLFYPSV